MAKKIILVTGSSRGIGRQTALALTRAGHTVYASMRSPSEAAFSEAPMEIQKNIFLKSLM